jgi:pseudouridine kinase
MSNSVLVIGAQNIDVFTKTNEPYTLKDSNVCSVSMAFGGVGRNIVENLTRLGNNVSFMTVFSTDYFGQVAKQSLLDMGVTLTNSIDQEGYANSIYLGILDEDNDLYLGLNDMEITKSLDPDYFMKHIDYINSFDVVVIDNNLSEESITYLLPHITSIKVMDAVSAHKLPKIAMLLPHIDYLKVNKLEHYELVKRYEMEKEMDIPNSLSLLVTNGPNRIKYLAPNQPFNTMPIACETIINASGAGDGFISGFVHGLLHNKDEVTRLEYAKRVAYITLQSNDATSKSLCKEEVEDETIY